ncbi:MAG TPA: PDZ domain-containing protein [Planctomycetota bacterium]|nr:PDZ domain-containing protein [Planctomycetota bacterium]
MTTRPWLSVALALMAAGTLSADTVVTKDQQTLKGRVVSEGKDTLVLRSPFGELTIPKGEIKEHQRAVYVVELKDGSKLAGQIRGETPQQLALKVDGKDRSVAQADVKGVTERVVPDATKLEAMRANALKLLQDKKYPEAIKLYQEILGAAPDDATSIYNLACAYSLTKEPAKAVAMLHRSLEAGFIKFGHIEVDPDWDGMRNDPGFQALMKERAKYIESGVALSVERVHKALAGRGIDPKAYKSLHDKQHNFVYLHTRSDEELAVVRKSLEQYGEWQWKRLLQNRPQDPIYIVLLSQADTPKVFPRSGGGVFNAASSVLLCGDLPAWKLVKTSVVMHEFTHALHFADMAARRQTHPIWLVEGLATLFETAKHEGDKVEPLHSQRLGILQQAIRARRSIAWAQVMGMNHAQFMQNAIIAYAQARYMLFYMLEKGLLKKFYDEYTEKESYADDKSALRTVEVVFGKPIQEVERDWKQWVLAQKVPQVPFLGLRTKADKGKLLVEEVVAKSPADKAGIKKGDVITTMDGQAMDDPNDMMEVIGGKNVGDEMAVQVQREGKTLDLKLKLAARPAGLGRPPTPPPAPVAFLGASVEEIVGGIRVREVVKDSPADKAGLQVGDPIVEVDGKPVGTVRQFLDALKAAKPDQTIKLTLDHDGQRETLEVKLAKLQ